MIDFMETSGMECMSLSEEGIYVGGINQKVRERRNWSFTHFFLFNAETDLRFRSLWVEDIIFSIDKQKMGKKVIATTDIAMAMPSRDAVKKQTGGMRDAYNQSSEYVTAFTPILSSPDCSRVHTKDGLIKHTKISNSFMVKYLSDRHRKDGDNCAR